jgi:hypothetical protein
MFILHLVGSPSVYEAYRRNAVSRLGTCEFCGNERHTPMITGLAHQALRVCEECLMGLIERIGNGSQLYLTKSDTQWIVSPLYPAFRMSVPMEVRNWCYAYPWAIFRAYNNGIHSEMAQVVCSPFVAMQAGWQFECTCTTSAHDNYPEHPAVATAAIPPGYSGRSHNIDLTALALEVVRQQQPPTLGMRQYQANTCYTRQDRCTLRTRANDTCHEHCSLCYTSANISSIPSRVVCNSSSARNAVPQWFITDNDSTNHEYRDSIILQGGILAGKLVPGGALTARDTHLRGFNWANPGLRFLGLLMPEALYSSRAVSNVAVLTVRVGNSVFTSIPPQRSLTNAELELLTSHWTKHDYGVLNIPTPNVDDGMSAFAHPATTERILRIGNTTEPDLRTSFPDVGATGVAMEDVAFMSAVPNGYVAKSALRNRWALVRGAIIRQHQERNGNTEIDGVYEELPDNLLRAAAFVRFQQTQMSNLEALEGREPNDNAVVTARRNALALLLRTPVDTNWWLSLDREWGIQEMLRYGVDVSAMVCSPSGHGNRVMRDFQRVGQNFYQSPMRGRHQDYLYRRIDEVYSLEAAWEWQDRVCDIQPNTDNLGIWRNTIAKGLRDRLVVFPWVSSYVHGEERLIRQVLSGHTVLSSLDKLCMAGLYTLQDVIWETTPEMNPLVIAGDQSDVITRERVSHIPVHQFAASRSIGMRHRLLGTHYRSATEPPVTIMLPKKLVLSEDNSCSGKAMLHYRQGLLLNHIRTLVSAHTMRSVTPSCDVLVDQTGMAFTTPIAATNSIAPVITSPGARMQAGRGGIAIQGYPSIGSGRQLLDSRFPEGEWRNELLAINTPALHTTDAISHPYSSAGDTAGANEAATPTA